MKRATALERIVNGRLNRWGQRLIKVNATPLLLIGLSHGKTGKTLTLDVPHQVTHPEIVRLLKKAIVILEGGDL